MGKGRYRHGKGKFWERDIMGRRRYGKGKVLGKENILLFFNLLTDSNATELVTNGNLVRMNPRGERDDVRTFHICDDKL